MSTSYNWSELESQWPEENSQFRKSHNNYFRYPIRESGGPVANAQRRKNQVQRTDAQMQRATTFMKQKTNYDSDNKFGIHTTSTMGERHHPSPDSLELLAKKIANGKLRLHTGPDAQMSGGKSGDYITIEDTIFEVVESLYADGIVPSVVDLWHRLREVLVDVETDLHQDKSAVISVCKASARFDVRTEAEVDFLNSVEDVPPWGERASSEPYIFLAKCPEWFCGWVDPRSTHDSFPQEIWSAFLAAVADLLCEPNCQNKRAESSLLMFQFKGGRYGLAMELKRRTLGLSKMRLGDVCHLVQLAINRGILCYEKSVLQPVASCHNRTQAFLRGNEAALENLLKAYGNGEVPSTPNPALSHSASFSGFSDDYCSSDYGGCQITTGGDIPPPVPLIKIIRLTSQILDGKPSGCELAEVARGLESKFKVKLQPESYGVTKMIDLFLQTELQSAFRLFCTTKTRHKVIIQLKKHKVPDWARPIQRRKKPKTEPLPEELWVGTPQMSSISLNHAKCYRVSFVEQGASLIDCDYKGHTSLLSANRHASNASTLSTEAPASPCVSNLSPSLDAECCSSSFSQTFNLDNDADFDEPSSSKQSQADNARAAALSCVASVLSPRMSYHLPPAMW